MPNRSLERRLGVLEAQAGIGADRVELVRTYQRADGSEYAIRDTWDRAKFEAWCEEQEAKLQAHNARLEQETFDPAKASINDLLVMGDYAEVVRRVETWHQWTSAALPVVLIKLADALRPTLTPGEADPMDRR